MRRIAWLALVLTAGPAAAANIDASAAWRGWAGPGGGGELLLQLPPAARAGRIDVIVLADGHRVESALDVKAAAASELRLPVPTDTPIGIQARMPDGSSSTGHFSFQLSERPLFAWAAGPPPPIADPDISLLAVAAEDFPRLPAGYGSVAAVALDETTLKAFDDSQVTALLSHLRSCGFTVLSAVSAEISSAFRQAAGCGGRQLVVSAEVVPPATALQLFKNRDAWTPLRGAALASLAPSDGRLAWVIVALVAYLAMAVATLALTSRPLWLFGVPAAATLLIGATLALLPPRQQIVIWAEAHGGDSQARYSGRLRLLGSARHSHSVTIPSLIDHADRCDASAPSQTRWDAPRQRAVSNELALRLFSTPELCFSGSFPLSYQARAARNAAGELLLTNAGGGSWQDASLVWEGRIYSASGLAAQQTLRAAPQRGNAPDVAAQRIAAERLGWGQAGLLLPLQLTALGADAGEARGWVLVSLPVLPAERT